MFDRLVTRPTALRRHRTGPLLKERLAYLARLAEQGQSVKSLRNAASYLLVVAEYLHLADRPGEVIVACVGIGLGSSSHGMVMEHSGTGTPEEMEAVVHRMLQESFMRRGLELERVVVRSVSHTVQRIGASVAATVLWWR